MLKAKSIKKIYTSGTKNLCVLNGIDFSVEKGEFVSIVGPSGAGKSTLLHILGGLDEPTEGKVYLGDSCFSDLEDDERAQIRNTRFGFVFQFYHLLREFSALENVMLPAMILNKTRPADIRSSALEALDFLGLKNRVHHRPSELSGGEQQRVAIARALINEPEILFCDEPTGNLDRTAGRQIQEWLRALNKDRKMTVVLVTHSQELAQGANRVLSIFDGRFAS